jgi:predicted metalloprotease with PDZ domain
MRFSSFWERSMQSARMLRGGIVILCLWAATQPATARPADGVAYTIRVTDPEKHEAFVDAVIPTDSRESVELSMALWSPGFYRAEDYAGRVHDVSARTSDGTALGVEQTRKNRWKVATGGKSSVTISYRLVCDQQFVTRNWVGESFGVFCGPATFLKPVQATVRSYEVTLKSPDRWKEVMTSLEPASDGRPNHFVAQDFDTLCDSPILAGELKTREFDVGGSKHLVVDAGDVGSWDSVRAAKDLETIVRENHRFWGRLPFRRYLFLNIFRQGGGGLEHGNCCVLTSRPAGKLTPPQYLRWLDFVSHEYFHAFNVKRLRPIELGPFDYESPPRTPSLWISEGLTTYFGELMLVRSGIASEDNFLAILSSHIGSVQNSPGRLVQTLEESSSAVWDSGTSGIGRDDAKSVSYYVKGPVVGFLLDAKVRRVTDGAKSLDDVMRLAYTRYGGVRGFKPEEFPSTAEEVAGCDLKEWFRKATQSADELDYNEALDWFGLRFKNAEKKEEAWTLEKRPDATAEQTKHFRAWVGQDRKVKE